MKRTKEVAAYDKKLHWGKFSNPVAVTGEDYLVQSEYWKSKMKRTAEAGQFKSDLTAMVTRAGKKLNAESFWELRLSKCVIPHIVVRVGGWGAFIFTCSFGYEVLTIKYGSQHSGSIVMYSDLGKPLHSHNYADFTTLTGAFSCALAQLTGTAIAFPEMEA